MKRGDIAKTRYLSWALDYMERFIAQGDAPEVAAQDAMCFVRMEAEHGGIGIARSTVRRACKEWAAWKGELLRTWAARTIATEAL